MGSVFLMLSLVLRCYAEPHPRYVADGTCLCFSTGIQGWIIEPNVESFFDLYYLYIILCSICILYKMYHVQEKEMKKHANIYSKYSRKIACQKKKRSTKNVTMKAKKAIQKCNQRNKEK